MLPTGPTLFMPMKESLTQPTMALLRFLGLRAWFNDGSSANHAVANKDLQFLALELGGEEATQSLVLDPYIKLMGRNEIRISNNGSLTVNQGAVSSLRWIEIQDGGLLKGNGSLDSTVYNHGELSASGSLHVSSDYRSSPSSSLGLTLGKEASLKINGSAQLAGELSLQLAPRFKIKKR